MSFARTLGVALVLATSIPAILSAQGSSRAAASIHLDDSLQRDPAIVAGTLPNGLHYLIRANKTPTKRAELRLVVNAGSVLEDSSQRGLAHFIEHMAFNGTAHFQKHEIIDYLQSIGMKFGADLNAYTNFDETVYRLTVPTDKQVLDTAIQILGDWAHDVTFDSTEVVAERGVILEERRMRSGVNMRTVARDDSVLYAGTPYVDRLPIGLAHRIETANASDLKRFYHDWYRPDLMTVVAVGDFDPKMVERLIKHRFNAIPKAVSPRPRPNLTIPLPEHPIVAIQGDPEQSNWNASLTFPKRSSEPPKTVRQFRAHMVDQLFVIAVNNRLTQLANQPTSPIVGARMGLGKLQRGNSTYTLNVTTRPGQYQQGINAALTEIQRIAQYGVTPTELSRETKQFVTNVESSDLANDTRKSAELANDYVNMALNPGVLVLSSKEAIAIVRALVPKITSADLQAVAKRVQDAPGPVLLGSIPQNGTVPSDSVLLASIQAVDTASVTPYADNLAATPLLDHPPQPGKIVNERHITSLDVYDLTLSNGVRVLLKPTNFNPGHLELRGFKSGGTSLATDADYIDATLSPTVIGISGLGDFTQSDIRDKLAGTVVGVGTNIGMYDESAFGKAASRDLTPLFELLYMKFTEPRIDTVAVTNWQNTVRTRGVNGLELELRNLATGHNPRARAVFGQMVDSLQPSDALSFYKSRFGNADGFTFAIVGDFNVDSMKPYVARYLGGLPSNGTREHFRDLDVRPVNGPVRRVVFTNGVEPLSQTHILFTGDAKHSRLMQREIGALASALQIELTKTLREKLGGTYTVQVNGMTTEQPYPHYELNIIYTSAPDRAGEMQQAVFATIDTLMANGPTAAEVESVKEAQRREIETAKDDNTYWANMLTGYVQNGWDLTGLLHEASMSDQFTIQSLQAAAKHYLVAKNSIAVTSIPQRFAKVHLGQSARHSAATPADSSSAPHPVAVPTDSSPGHPSTH
jgi:zinc protease